MKNPWLEHLTPREAAKAVIARYDTWYEARREINRRLTEVKWGGRRDKKLARFYRQVMDEMDKLKSTPRWQVKGKKKNPAQITIMHRDGLHWYVYTVLKSKKVRRKYYEDDGFSVGCQGTRYMTRKQANADAYRLLDMRDENNEQIWFLERDNPGKIIRPGTDYFIKSHQMRQLQEEFYAKTRRWLAPSQIREFLREIVAQERRKRFRIVK